MLSALYAENNSPWALKAAVMVGHIESKQRVVREVEGVPSILLM